MRPHRQQAEGDHPSLPGHDQDVDRKLLSEKQIQWKWITSARARAKATEKGTAKAGSKDNGQGKSKGKSKDRNRDKSKSNSKGKGSGNPDNDKECYVRGKKCHFARDCWSRANQDKIVNEIEVENVNAKPGKDKYLRLNRRSTT